MQQPGTPLTSIIILAKNEARNTGACLDAVFSQRFGGEFEVILIDSGSTDATVEIAQRYPLRLERISPEAFHHSRTRNMGASMARGRYVVYLTADATPVDERWLGSLLDGLDEPEIAGCYGRQLPRRWAYPMERFFLSQLYPSEPRRQRIEGGAVDLDTTWFSNVNSVLKREIWERIPFDETVVMTEDQVWSRRVLEAGYTLLYHPEAAVYHCHNYSLVKAFRRFFDSGMTSQASYMPSEQGAMSGLGARGLRYLNDEMRFLLANGYALWAPYALLYEMAKFTGIAAGRQHRRLPRSLVALLSHNTRRSAARVPH